MQANIAGRVPDWYWDVPYVAARYPGAVPRDQLRLGANCQLFAYEVLALFGFIVPDVRSSELWTDTTATRAVGEEEPLDLLLFNREMKPWGAHVGVSVGDGEVLHLCEEVGLPAVWTLREFAERPRYSCIVGIKRPTRTPVT